MPVAIARAQSPGASPGASFLALSHGPLAGTGKPTLSSCANVWTLDLGGIQMECSRDSLVTPRLQQVGQEATWVVLSPGNKTLTLSVYFRWEVGGHSLLGT